VTGGWSTSTANATNGTIPARVIRLETSQSRAVAAPAKKPGWITGPYGDCHVVFANVYANASLVPFAAR
jgi:hypothetical protein